MIKFKLLNNRAKLPKRVTSGSAGFDLGYSGDSCVLKEGEHGIFETGVAMQIDDGEVGIIKPRSGWAAKYGIDVLAGVIEADYTGEIKVILINHGRQPLHIYTGDRIAQLVVVPHLSESCQIDNLHATDRGCSGFGSTGVN
jgi:dUTP pyrophosphatase